MTAPIAPSPTYTSGPAESGESDPSDLVPYSRLPVVVRRRADLSPAAKVLYSYVDERWRQAKRRPVQIRRETGMRETGMTRHAYTAAARELEKAELIYRKRTSRATLYSLQPIQTITKSAKPAIPSPRPAVPSLEEAIRALPPPYPWNNREDVYDLFQELAEIGYVVFDPGRPGRARKNVQAVYYRLDKLASEVDDDPVEWLRREVEAISRRRVPPEVRTRFVAALIHRGLPECMEYLLTNPYAYGHMDHMNENEDEDDQADDCRHCGRPLPAHSHPSRQWCSERCRIAASRARQAEATERAEQEEECEL